MSDVTVSTLIQAPAQQVWPVISDFHNVHVFHPFLHSTEQLSEQDVGVGAARQCNLHNHSSLVETVVQWEEGRSFTVRASPQRLVGVVTGQMRVDPVDAQRCTVTVHTQYTPTWGLLGRVLDRLVMRVGIAFAVRRVLKGLRTHVELGGAGHRVGAFGECQAGKVR